MMTLEQQIEALRQTAREYVALAVAAYKDGDYDLQTRILDDAEELANAYQVLQRQQNRLAEVAALVE